MADIKALVDSGATNCFMSENFIRQMKLGKRPLQRKRKIWNIDNMANQAGDITHYITLDIQTGRVRKTIQFLVTNIGNEDVILGYPWMAAFEPKFAWKNSVINEKELPIILQSVNPSTPGKEPIMRLMHGWPGKTLFWLLSRTTPAAHTVPRFGQLKPLLFHIPFGIVTSLSCLIPLSTFI